MTKNSLPRSPIQEILKAAQSGDSIAELANRLQELTGMGNAKKILEIVRDDGPELLENWTDHIAECSPKSGKLELEELAPWIDSMLSKNYKSQSQLDRMVDRLQRSVEYEPVDDLFMWCPAKRPGKTLSETIAYLAMNPDAALKWG